MADDTTQLEETAYVVYGRTYDATRTWPLVTHLTEERAIEHCTKAYAEAQMLQGKSSDDTQALSTYDPWRHYHAPTGEAVYFYALTVVITGDDASWEDETIEAMKAQMVQHALVTEQGG